MMRFRRRTEKKAAVGAFRKEVRTHKWFLYVLATLASLLIVYETSTGALTLQGFAALLFLLLLAGFIRDWIHKRNLKMLRLVLTIFSITMVVSAFSSAPAVHACGAVACLISSVAEPGG